MSAGETVVSREWNQWCFRVSGWRVKPGFQVQDAHVRQAIGWDDSEWQNEGLPRSKRYRVSTSHSAHLGPVIPSSVFHHPNICPSLNFRTHLCYVYSIYPEFELYLSTKVVVFMLHFCSDSRSSCENILFTSTAVVSVFRIVQSWELPRPFSFIV